MIYFVRHGESVGNAANRHQTPELPLSEAGEAQARLRGRTLKDKNISQIFSSPYMRAHQTAQLIRVELGDTVPLTIVDRLHEVKNPSVLNGRLKTDLDVIELKAELNRNRLNPLYQHSDEETLFMLYDRIVDLLTMFEQYTDQDIVVVSHGGVLRMLLAYLQTKTEPLAAVTQHLALNDHSVYPINNVAMLSLDFQNAEWHFKALHNLE